MIKFYAGNGIDATQAYTQFHVRSVKANKYMNSLPSRNADEKEVESTRLPGQSALLKDFDKLTADLKAEGFFEPAPLHVLYRVIEVVLMYVIGIYFLFNAETMSAKLGGIFLMGMAVDVADG